MVFRDHFSKFARDYAQYRPRYPGELFAYLAEISPARTLAWDCGTGNGQAAAGLAQHFERVIATDASPDQIAHAQAHARVEYRVEQAESTSLAANSCDLVTVALAVHWFELERFYAEARRVLKPGGVLAVWSYHLPAIAPEIDRTVRGYYALLAGYWPPLFHYVDERYQTLPFPFAELRPPDFSMRAEWDLGQFAGFLASWSASRRYMEQHGQDPLEPIWDELSQTWGEASRRRAVQWPMFVRIGRTNSPSNLMRTP